jgi:type IV pilus assembly protein PilE
MNSSLRRNRGVTLVELLIVMVIVGILTAIAYPSYQRYTTRTYRAAARACLTETAQFMERYYTSNMTYVGAEGALTLGCMSESGLDTKYTFAATPAPTQRTFTIAATPIGVQLTRDTECGTLTLDEVGTRTKSGSGTLAKCW